VTAEFNPLRDEGIAYAEALAAAGVPVNQLQARGHFHASFTMVDVIATAVSGREKMAQALQRFAGLEEPGALPKAAEWYASKTGVDWRPIVDTGALEREAHPAEDFAAPRWSKRQSATAEQVAKGTISSFSRNRTTTRAPSVGFGASSRDRGRDCPLGISAPEHRDRTEPHV
jgi:hypothetical protein